MKKSSENLNIFFLIFIRKIQEENYSVIIIKHNLKFCESPNIPRITELNSV